MLASAGFANAERMSRFLRYVVARTLAGERDRLKEYAIGVDVFDRNEDYDPRVDSIVRVEAARLRAKIDEYYNGPGTDDRVVIRLRRGSYVPHFEARPTAASARSLVAGAGTNSGPPTSRWPLGTSAAMVALVVLAAVAWRTAPWMPDGPAPGVRIAVLPLADFSEPRGDTMLAAQLTDGITTELARRGTLAVVSHTSAVQAAGRPLREAARALDAALVVEGSVVRKDDRVHVSVRLIDAAKDRKVWVQDFDGTVSDLPKLQRDIANSVATAVTQWTPPSF